LGLTAAYLWQQRQKLQGISETRRLPAGFCRQPDGISTGLERVASFPSKTQLHSILPDQYNWHTAQQGFTPPL